MDKTLKQLRKSSTQRGERESLKREMRTLRKELYERENRALKDVLNNVDIILATLTTTGNDGPLKHIIKNKDITSHFDIIIIDECSQALEAACWIPVVQQGARKLILAGDHLQLPPTIVSNEAAALGLDLTLMKRLIDAPLVGGTRCTRMLTTQYRMNEVICEWVSERLYESRLKAHESSKNSKFSKIEYDTVNAIESVSKCHCHKELDIHGLKI
jgi:ATP-dependent RNA/DNA helicase IGHMBP2